MAGPVICFHFEKNQNLISLIFWLEESFWCWHIWNGTIENTNNNTLPLPRVFTVRPWGWVRRPLHVLTWIHTITTAAGKTQTWDKRTAAQHMQRRGIKSTRESQHLQIKKKKKCSTSLSHTLVADTVLSTASLKAVKQISWQWQLIPNAAASLTSSEAF